MSGYATGLPPVPMYVAIAGNEANDVARFAASSGAVQSAVQYFQAEAPKITTPAQLLGNYRVLQVVLNAFNMSGTIDQTGILKQLMTQDPSAPSSLARQLGNPNYLRFAEYMSSWQPPPFSDANTVQVIANQYKTNSFEQQQGQEIPGMQQALYFRRNIASATSIDQIMADPTLLQVVVTGSGLPQQFGLLDFSQQQAILQKAIDPAKFQDPTYVDRFAEGYLALNSEQSGATSQSGGLLALFSPNGTVGADDLLAALYPGTSSGTSIAGLLLSATA